MARAHRKRSRQSAPRLKARLPRELAGVITYRDANAEDAEALAAFAAQAWLDTFGPQFSEADRRAYIARNYGPAQQDAEIANAGSHCHLAFEGDRLIGYCWTGANTLPTQSAERAIE